MSGTLDVRQFLSQHDAFGQGAAGYSGVPAQRTGEARISDEQVRRARLSVARSSLDPQDCRELLDMLGLLDGEDGIPPVRR